MNTKKQCALNCALCFLERKTMEVFNLFMNLLVDLTSLEEYMYCFTILLVIVSFDFVRRLSSC